jgi:hypothetical protein
MRLWIDTNSARKAVPLRDLARLGKEKGVQIAIHPQVYLEMRRHMRAWCRARGVLFDEGAFDGLLEQAEIAVIALKFDQLTAGAWADELARRYPTDKDWELAKKSTIGGQLRADFEVLPGKVPMTTDWLIALTVEGEPASRIITMDTKEEWRALHAMVPPRALSWEEALAWLRGLPDAVPAVPTG